MGYADLLEVFARLPEAGERVAAARTLGFVAVEPRVEGRAVGQQARASLPVSPVALRGEPPPVDPASPVLFWRATQVEYRFALDERPASTLRATNPDDPLTLADIGDPSPVEVASFDRPARLHIVPWSRLRRAMEAVYRSSRRSGELDVDAVVEAIGRGRVLARLPRRARGVRVSQLFVVLDRAPRLTPFWEDQIEVCQRVVREFGRTDLHVLIWEGGPPAWHGGPHEALAAISDALQPGDALVVLSDLGLYARDESGEGVEPSSSTRRWIRLGRALGVAGVRCAALLPCPRARWRPELDGAWTCIDWGDPQAESVASQDGPEPGDALACLVALLSLCVAIEPDLIRALRQLVPGADLGTEADAWNHPGSSRTRWNLGLGASLRVEGERRLLSMFDDPLERVVVEQAVEVIRQYHCVRAREISIEQTMRSAAVCHFASRPELVDKALGFRDGVDLDGWLMRAMAGVDPRMSHLARLHPAFGEELGKVVELAVARRPEHLRSQALPTGYGVDTFAPDGGPRRGWVLDLCGDSLRVRAPGGTGGLGYPLGDLVGYTNWVSVGAAQVQVGDEASWKLPELGERRAVATTGQRLWLERVGRPSWAAAAGADEHGLWAIFEVGGMAQRMRWIPPGRFLMGSPETEDGRWDDEGPEHAVTITRGFWIADTPCTQGVWEAMMGDNPSRFGGSAARPVEQVSWDDVQRFIERLDEMTGPGFGLPTEAQWEYACRAGNSGARYGPLDEVAWYSDNSGYQTHEVGLKQANRWGMYDMLGNVDEWCLDRWRDSEYQLRAVDDPEGPASGQNRVMRGGSWDMSARFVRAAYRLGYRSGLLGFRLVRGQGLRQPDERSDSKASKGEQAREVDPTGGGPASPREDGGR